MANDSSTVKCRVCRRSVPWRRPPGGDGTTVLAWRHPNSAGDPCEGSGEEHSIQDIRPAGAVEEADEPELDEQKGPIQPKTTGGWVKRRIIVGDRLYQLQYMRCNAGRGKRAGWKCRCQDPDPTKGHGPYWICYTTASRLGGRPGRGGEWWQRYIGKDTSDEPEDFQNALARARR